MKIIHSETPEELGSKAAKHAAELLRQAISQNNNARLLLSTGASQFTTLEALVKEKLDWDKVEMFHLDEYIGITEDHPASFVRYLNERFVNKVNLKAVHFVNTSGDIDEAMKALSAKVNESPIDVGLIGIGENAHIAFNDPPADFDNDNAFIAVNLIDSCRQQQFGEGWFKSIDDVPKTAVTMTVKQILKCKKIISAVPYKVKSNAIRDVLAAAEITPEIPATALKQHPDVTVYLDKDSASLIK